MARYDLKCKRCNTENTYHIPETIEKKVKIGDFSCDYCGCDEMEVISYYQTLESQLYSLQQQVEDLERIINKICGIDADCDCDTKELN